MPLRVNRVKVTDMPVAMGNTTQDFIRSSPAIRRASLAINEVIFAMRDEPAAFGWGSAISPDLPTPCANR